MTDDGGKKKIIIIGVTSGLVLVAIAVGVAVGVTRNNNSKEEAKDEGSGNVKATSKAVKAMCEPTGYKEACINTLNSKAGNKTDPKELIEIGFQAAIEAIKEAINNSSSFKETTKDPRTTQALKNCDDLLETSIDELQRSYERMGTSLQELSEPDNLHDIKVLISGAITFEDNCLDEFENISGDYREKMEKMLNISRELTRNSIDMMTELSSILGSLNTKTMERRLLGEREENGFPAWVNDAKRAILMQTPATIMPNVVVAQDGSGKYRTISEALKEVPQNNEKTFVIYIKAGIYKEYVEVSKIMNNVMFIGDGPLKTKITGSKNFIDGVQTMNTATVAIVGDYFMAKDIGFENTAGAIKHQAVALRVQSFKSIFYNCHMDAFQDTLYAQALTQYFRDCTIGGTIDFIFGNSAALFQNCQIIIKKPMEKQPCPVTAQGRDYQNTLSGFVLQNCTIIGDPEYIPVKDINKGYLGRPWKEFSRTIVMQSDIGDVIQPEGWLTWEDKPNFENTCSYAEYGNRGPGSVATGRVKWKGVWYPTPESINDFTVDKFIGESWIKPSGVPYTLGMMKV